MRKQDLTTKAGKKIYIYDDVFDFSTQDKLAHYIWSSYYKPVGVDRGFDGNTSNHLTMMSIFSEEEHKNSHFFDYLPEEIQKEHNIGLHTLSHGFANMVTPSDRFHVHSDNTVPDPKTFLPEGELDHDISLLYYPSIDWHIEYGGDTLFLDETGLNVEFFSQYTSGRIIIFDCTIPHLMRPSTTLAPNFRFSWVIKFLTNENFRNY